MPEDLVLFSWGYGGWGNATDLLVKAVDRVERSRGWGKPVFVDIRARRQARAKGFCGNALGDLLGDRRYKWMKGLGNKAILDDAHGAGLVDPAQVGELLKVAIDARNDCRRVTFFLLLPDSR